MDRAVFHEKLEGIVSSISSREFLIDVDFLKKFCELTGHDFADCQKRDLAPLGFFMTFTSPVLTEIILSVFVKYPDIIKGVIHSCSDLKLFGPFRLSSRLYQTDIKIVDIKEKKGKKNDYFAVDFEVNLHDDAGEKIATDLHQFFLVR